MTQDLTPLALSTEWRANEPLPVAEHARSGVQDEQGYKDR